LVKTENGSRGGQPYREVQIAQRCLAPLPLKDSNDTHTITKFIAARIITDRNNRAGGGRNLPTGEQFQQNKGSNH
jgi:hypothetical protein